MVTHDGNENSATDWLRELLAAQAEALTGGSEHTDDKMSDRAKAFDDFDSPAFSFDHYRVASEQVPEARHLLHLASQLRDVLNPVDPSLEFSMRLKNELVGQAPVTLAVRWRKLPAHYRLAARLGGFTITAGITLLAVRRALNVVGMLHRRGRKAESGLSFKTAL
ncbi:MAG: hypothetical protein ABI947_16065 [Chloroflexota bacterium]